MTGQSTIRCSQKKEQHPQEYHSRVAQQLLYIAFMYIPDRESSLQRVLGVSDRDVSFCKLVNCLLPFGAELLDRDTPVHTSLGLCLARRVSSTRMSQMLRCRLNGVSVHVAPGTRLSSVCVFSINAVGTCLRKVFKATPESRHATGGSSAPKADIAKTTVRSTNILVPINHREGQSITPNEAHRPCSRASRTLSAISQLRGITI